MNYLPSFDNNSCIVVDNLYSGYIRVYDGTPALNSTRNYTDYFIRDNYISRTGSTTWGNYSTLPTCVSHDQFTTDYYYRIDFPSILIMFFIMSIFIFYIPIKIWSKLFKRGSL